MKALFYGGSIAALAGLALGMGMEVPSEPAPTGADIQPIAEQVASADSGAYASDTYPPAYVIDAAYNGQPVTELRDDPTPVYQPAVFDQPVADQVIKASWTAPQTSEATPQDVAAAGDTTPAPPPEEPAEPQVRTYASIDAVLNQQQVEAPGKVYGPS